MMEKKTILTVVIAAAACVLVVAGAFVLSLLSKKPVQPVPEKPTPSVTVSPEVPTMAPTATPTPGNTYIQSGEEYDDEDPRCAVTEECVPVWKVSVRKVYTNNLQFSAPSWDCDQSGELMLERKPYPYGEMPEELSKNYVPEYLCAGIERTFDANGNVYEETEYRWFDEETTMALAVRGKETVTASETTYTYDSHGNPFYTGERGYFALGGSWHKYHHEYKYDEKGRIVRDIVKGWDYDNPLKDDRDICYTYNVDGRVAVKTIVNPNGTVYDRIIYSYEYDYAGRLTSVTSTGDWETVKKEYHYDSKGILRKVFTSSRAKADYIGNCDELREYDENGVLTQYSLIHYKYDIFTGTYSEEADVYSVSYLPPNGRKKLTNSYSGEKYLREYVYDNHWNVIEQKTYTEKGQLLYREEFTYTLVNVPVHLLTEEERIQNGILP